MSGHSSTPRSGQLNDFAVATGRVREYFERQFFAREIAEGSKLPPVRHVAAELGVSTAAVYTVYREYQEAGRVVSVVGRGTFIAPGQNGRGNLRIAISLGVMEAALDYWRNEMIGGLLEAASSHPEMTVRPLSNQQILAERLDESWLEDEISRTDALILLPMLEDTSRKLIQCCEAQGKLIVRINPPAPFQTENFVSSDYYRFGLELGTVWLESGRRNILLVGPPNNAPSWVQRLAGFETALSRQRDHLKVVQATSLMQDSGYEIMKEVLASGYRPDAVFAFGDLLAFGVRDALREAGISIPGEASVVGGTGMNILWQSGLSAQINDCFAIGRAVLDMVALRHRTGGASAPAVYIPIGLRQGGSTRPLEHTIWKQRHKP